MGIIFMEMRLEQDYDISILAAGTGVPFHFHGPGFGEVIFGRKVIQYRSNLHVHNI
jgi:hypothetical protein